MAAADQVAGPPSPQTGSLLQESVQDGDDTAAIGQSQRFFGTDEMERIVRRTAALLMLCAAVSQGALGGPLEEALAAYDAGDYRKASGLLQPLAQQGNASAQLRLGLLYYLGQGVPEDERAAVDWMRKSAEQGNLDAMYHLGNAFTFGTDTPKLTADSDVEAAQWYFRAAQGGHRDAQYALGLMFLAGKGVVQSRDQALVWIHRAAAQGHAEARSFVSGMEGRR